MSAAFGFLALALGTLLLNVAAKVIADDARTAIPRAATKIIVWAAQRLPREHQARWAEEWLAALGEMDERSRMLWHALGCMIAIPRLRAELGERSSSAIRRVWRLKAATDRFGGLVLLIWVAPVMAIIGLAIKFESRGPVFFRQSRFGARGQIVVVTKFRTTRSGGSTLGGPKRIVDVTEVGRFLRKTCLDELPQLWDVVCGRMSLVGLRL